MTPEDREYIHTIREAIARYETDRSWWQRDMSRLLDLVERQDAETRNQLQRIEALELCARESWCQCGHQLGDHDSEGCYGCACKALHAVHGAPRI